MPTVITTCLRSGYRKRGDRSLWLYGMNHACQIPNTCMSRRCNWDQRPNSWTQLGQKSLEFSSLLFTVTSTDPSKSGLKLVCNANIVSQVCELSRLCPETSTKLYGNEFGFCPRLFVHRCIQRRVLSKMFEYGI
jgi:hypothetical protein